MTCVLKIIEYRLETKSAMLYMQTCIHYITIGLLGSSPASCGGCISMGHEKTEICLMSEVILPHTVMLRLLVSTIWGQDGNRMPLNVAVETRHKYVMLV